MLDGNNNIPTNNANMENNIKGERIMDLNKLITKEELDKIVNNKVEEIISDEVEKRIEETFDGQFEQMIANAVKEKLAERARKLTDKIIQETFDKELEKEVEYGGNWCEDGDKMSVQQYVRTLLQKTISDSWSIRSDLNKKTQEFFKREMEKPISEYIEKISKAVFIEDKGKNDV